MLARHLGFVTQDKESDMAQTELLLQTLDAIENKDVTWNQRDWRYCFAGNALRLSGMEPKMVFDAEAGGLVVVVDIPGEGQASVRAAARDILGLSDTQAIVLFRSTNKLHHLQQIVSELVQETIDAEMAEQTPEMQTA